MSVQEATVRFGGITALDGVSLEVGSGEVVGVIGPNGAGKTTLFNLICGFVRADSGSLHWRGQSLARVRPDRLAGARDRPHAAGRGAVRAPDGARERDGRRRALPARAARQRAARASRRSDSDERALRERAARRCTGSAATTSSDRLPGTLPYAIQKRVALARALVGEPELLLLDEPAGGLDADELTELGELIMSLGNTIAVMLVDHHMDLVTSVCDRMVVLDFGRVIASGVPPRGPPGPARARGVSRARGRGRRRAPSDRRSAMLRVEDLTTDYGPVRAVDHVSLEVPPGSVTAVLGANGAGKTSLLRTITGLVRPSAGRVTFDGEDITRLPVEEIVRRGIAHVPEGRGVITELTVEENLRLGGLWRGRDAAPRTEIYELFPRLEERADQPASRLSGGERQMLSIGRALVARPRALLLDEPSLGLAPLLVAQIMSLVRRLADTLDLAVLLVEQNARSALSISERGVVLNLGRVVADVDAAELAADERLRHAYLGF